MTDTLEGCCLNSLLEISDTFNTAVLRHLEDALPKIIERRNQWGDAIADAAIVSDNPDARAAAIDWRNWRRRRSRDDS